MHLISVFPGRGRRVFVSLEFGHLDIGPPDSGQLSIRPSDSGHLGIAPPDSGRVVAIPGRLAHAASLRAISAR